MTYCMDNIETLWANGDVDVALKELQTILSSREEDQSLVNEALLISAYMHFQLGKIGESIKLLEQVKFKVFHLQQWVVESNMLIIKYLKNTDSQGSKGNATVIQEIPLLLEKVQGLPSSNVALLEIQITFNYALAIFVSNARESIIPGGYEIAQTKIQMTIQRVLNIGLNEDLTYSSLSILEKLKLFCDVGINIKNTVLDEVFYPVTLLCWLLSVFWLLENKIKEAQELIQMIIKLHNAKSHHFSLKKTGYLFTLMKYDNVSEMLTTSCNLVLCYCSLLNHDRQQALKQCDVCLKAKSDFVPALLMKGLILYENESYSEVLSCLQQVVSLSEGNSYKATALNLLGCACVKLGKPHTALVKYRTSFECSDYHVEPLYNVGLVYHDLKSYDLEITLLQHLLKIISSRSSRETTVCRKKINVACIAGITSKILDRVITKGDLLISVDIYCVQNTSYNPSLNYHGVLYKLAHNCLQQKRYKEAAQFFIDFLALIEKKPVDVKKISLPSLVVIFRETAEALYESARYEDALTICDKVLLQSQALVSNEESSTTGVKRAPVIDAECWSETKTLVGVLFCKADVMIKLERPVEAYECYERVFELLNSAFFRVYHRNDDHMVTNQQDPKRQKTDMGPKGMKHDKESENNIDEYEKLQALTMNKQGALLTSLGRREEALLLFARSIGCQPDVLKYHYDHVSLLFDLGKKDDACHNWLKIRKLDNEGKDVATTSNAKEPCLEDDENSSLYAAMDALALQNCPPKS